MSEFRASLPGSAELKRLGQTAEYAKAKRGVCKAVNVECGPMTPFYVDRSIDVVLEAFGLVAVEPVEVAS